MAIRHRRWSAAGVAALLTALALPVAHAQTAVAETANGERIDSYSVQMRLRADGSMDVVEDVEYDFGTASDKHGFYRTLRTRQEYRGKEDTYRDYPVSHVRVSSPSGAPAGRQIDESTNSTTIRIGDPDRTVSGVQKYRIAYRLRGVANGFSDHTELYWNVLGDGFQVPIEQASARVTAPADITKVACYAGDVGAKRECGDASRNGSTAQFGASGITSGEAFTVVVGMPKGAVATKPILVHVERREWPDAFELGPANVVGAAFPLLLAGAWFFWLVRRRKRFAPDGSAAPAGTYSLAALRSGESGAVTVRGDGPVVFSPPGGLRPGQVGTLYDDSADTVDVTATIVDLAVRGYLVIDRLEGDDWGLRMLKPPGPEFLPYERKFFDTLFYGKPAQVRMSTLKNTFAGTLKAIKDLMYQDLESRGLFLTGRPDRTKKIWRWVGYVVALISVYSLWNAVTDEPYRGGVAALTFGLAGASVAFCTRYIPSKTEQGLALKGQVEAFKAEMDGLDFTRLPEDCRDDIVSRYLPYAMAFGKTNEWTEAFDRLEQHARHTGTHVYHPYWYGMAGGFHAQTFTASMGTFAATTGSTLSSTPGGSGSSGFSSGGGSAGGGGGGGGGGSW